MPFLSSNEHIVCVCVCVCVCVYSLKAYKVYVHSKFLLCFFLFSFLWHYFIIKNYKLQVFFAICNKFIIYYILSFLIVSIIFCLLILSSEYFIVIPTIINTNTIDIIIAGYGIMYPTSTPCAKALYTP